MPALPSTDRDCSSDRECEEDDGSASITSFFGGGIRLIFVGFVSALIHVHSALVSTTTNLVAFATCSAVGEKRMKR